MQSNFPVILSSLRRGRGISQKQAAADLGVSQSLLSHYEKGIRECGLAFLVRAADYYGVSTDYLLGRMPSQAGSAENSENTAFVDDKRMLINSISLIVELLRRCDRDEISDTGIRILKLQMFHAARLIMSICPGDTLFTLPEEYTICAANGEIMQLSANLRRVASKQDTRMVPIVSESHLKEEYPELYTDLKILIRTIESRMK